MAFLTRVSIVIAAMLATFSNTAAEDETESDPGWLFVAQGTVLAINSADIVLAADPKVVAFTERPARQAQVIALADLVASAWGEGGDFRRDPPNASLIDENNGHIGIVTMTTATVDGGTLEFGYVMVDGSLPELGDRIALTIDVMHPTQY
jgi:hypothetical protein